VIALRCCECGRTNEQLAPSDDVRPYGPGGQPICHACAMSTPELRAIAKRAIDGAFDRIEAAGDVAVIGDDLYGVEPLKKRDS